MLGKMAKSVSVVLLAMSVGCDKSEVSQRRHAIVRECLDPDFVAAVGEWTEDDDGAHSIIGGGAWSFERVAGLRAHVMSIENGVRSGVKYGTLDCGRVEADIMWQEVEDPECEGVSPCFELVVGSGVT